jgi:rubredoxin
VVQKFDVGTHVLFIGEVIDAQTLDEVNEPITYSFYRNVKKAVASKNAPTYIDKSKLSTKTEQIRASKYKCTACGFIYDEGIEPVKFKNLPDNWKCPFCKTEKEYFVEV